MKQKVKMKPRRLHIRTHSRIEIILRAVQELYPHDATRPGLVMSWLPEKGFYVSLNRYEGPEGQRKERIYHTTAKTLDGALKALTVGWRSKTEYARKLELI
jgi:hypothetical protein